MDPWCRGCARGVVDVPVGKWMARGVADGTVVWWMGPWWSGWARGVVDGPVV